MPIARATLRAHRLGVGRQLGLFGDDDDVHIEHDIAGCGQLSPTGRAEQRDAVGILPRRIRIGKVTTDITRARRAKDRVGDSVTHGVGVRMPGEPLVERDRDAAKHEPSARHESVQVVSVADPERRSADRSAS